MNYKTPKRDEDEHEKIARLPSFLPSILAETRFFCGLTIIITTMNREREVLVRYENVNFEPILLKTILIIKFSFQTKKKTELL